MSHLIENTNQYSFGPCTKKVLITFEVALDMVPGWGDCPEDHIQLAFKNNPYICKVIKTEDAPKDLVQEAA